MAIKLYKSQLTPTTESSNVMNRNRVSMSEAASIGNAWKGMVKSGELLYAKHQDIKTDNEQIKQILHNLFYDILNIEFNLWPWVRNMCKYGDFFLKLEIDEKYGVTNVVPLSVYDVSRLEGLDLENPEYVKFLVESTTNEHRYKSETSATREELENYEVAHFRLLSDSNYLPYGKSQIEGGRKIYKQLTLMEDAMLIHRIMRAPEKRIFKLDIGNIPPAEVDNYMQQVINKMKSDHEKTL